MMSSASEKLLRVCAASAALALCAPTLTAAALGGPASRGSLKMSGAPVRAAAPKAQAARTKAGAKVYRGSIGGRGVEVSLRREAERVSGSYGYDGAAGRLRLEGRVGSDGKLTLAEYDRAGRQTGKFACEPGGGDAFALDIDLECEWSKADGGDRTYAGLTEQHAGFTRAWRVEPRHVVNRRYGVGVTYPQIVAARPSPLTPGAQAFNRRAAALAAGLAREFAAEPPERGMYLKTNYDVLLATDDLISVEIEEERDFGGGRPGTRYFGLTSDLRSAGRELRLADLFKTDAEFEQALRLHSHREINRRYREISRREGAAGAAAGDAELTQPAGGDEIAAWTMTTRGLVVYFNFPQVTAAFDRNFVPYAAVKDLLRPDGPAAALALAAP